MTVWFKEDWNAYEAGDIANLPASVEADLVANGKAIDQAKVLQLAITPFGGVAVADPDNGNPITVAGWFDIRSYGAKCDGQMISDAVITSISGTTYKVVSASGLFKASDVGMKAATTRLITGSQFGWNVVISAYVSPTEINITCSNSGCTGTNSLFVWGTDDAAAINAATAAAAAAFPCKGTVYFPNAITCVGSSITIPDGVVLRGTGNFATTNSMYSWTRFSGSWVCAIDYFAGQLVNFGTTFNVQSGTQSFDITFDAMNLVGGCGNNSRANNAKNTTFCRGVGKGLVITGSGVVENSVICNSYRGTCLRQTGDSRVLNNYLFGAGIGLPTVEIQGSDIIFGPDNHLWRDGDTNPAGDLVLVKCDGTGLNADGEITVVANKFDTPVGACIYVKITGNGVLRTLNIEDNGSITNDAVQNQPSATFAGSITSNVLTVSSVSAGTIYAGARVAGGTVADGVYVGQQLTGTPGGAGTYTCVGANATGITSAIGYPYIILDIAAGCTLRALNVNGNTGFGSWATPAKSPYACFIDGSRILGSVLVANIHNNTLDNCGVGYSNFAQGANLGGGTVGVLNSSNNYCIPNLNSTTVGTAPAAF